MKLVETKTTKFIAFVAISFLVLSFSACSVENPFEKAEDDLSDMNDDAQRIYDKSQASSDKKQNTGSYEDRANVFNPSNSNYKSSNSKKSDDLLTLDYTYSSSSSSRRTSSSSYISYTTEPKTLVFTFTYFEQTSPSWNTSKEGIYGDAYPRVTFEVQFIKLNNDTMTYSTKKIDKDWFYKKDIGVWTGRLSFETTVPIQTKEIRVCPKVEDLKGINEDLSSGKCYTKSNIGQIENNAVIKQSDTYNRDCDLQWEWYLTT